jgi:hypothetical protein
VAWCKEAVVKNPQIKQSQNDAEVDRRLRAIAHGEYGPEPQEALRGWQQDR